MKAKPSRDFYEVFSLGTKYPEPGTSGGVLSGDLALGCFARANSGVV